MRPHFFTGTFRGLGQAGLAALWIVAFATQGHAVANPPLHNPSFELVGPSGPLTVNSSPAPGGAGYSAAEGWGVFHNTVPPGGATTQTELLPTTLPWGGTRMIHVVTDQPLNGLVATTGPLDSGALQGIGSAWVLVTSGVVGLGTGNGGNTGIDVTSTTTGVWEYLQAPSGQSPFNEIILYAVGGPAEYYVDEASMHSVQEADGIVRVEYSNRPDEQAVPGGGDHGGPDPGQTLYTQVVDDVLDPFPFDGVDFFPGIESGEEPDAQVDALANGLDFGFAELLADKLDFAFSLEGDPFVGEPIAAFAERADGTNAVAWTHRDLHALNIAGDIDDIDALELWGSPADAADDSTDADFYSLELDQNDVSVWVEQGGVSMPYLTRSLILARLAGVGFTGSIEEVDVDALLVRDANVAGQWDAGDEILFSIRASNNFDGGEIMHMRHGQQAVFFQHGGHTWDTAFDIQAVFGVDTDEVDAIEVPEPGTTACLASGACLLLGLSRRRGASR